MIRVFRNQLRIIGAIAIREINSQESTLMYGYAWALIDTLLGVMSILLMKLVIRAFNPPGLPPATFIMSAILPFSMFNGLYGSIERSLIKYRKLRTLFPIVTELDCVLGCSVQIMVTRLIVLVGATTVSSYIEDCPFPVFFPGIMLLLLSIWIMGISFGYVLMLVYRVYRPIAMFMSVVLRPMMILSSVFVPITRFPSYTWPYLTWNPMLHVEELLHSYWFRDYHSPVASVPYLMECMLVMAAFGVVCERYARLRLPLV